MNKNPSLFMCLKINCYKKGHTRIKYPKITFKCIAQHLLALENATEGQIRFARNIENTFKKIVESVCKQSINIK